MNAIFWNITALYSVDMFYYLSERLPNDLLKKAKEYVQFTDQINFLSGRYLLQQMLLEKDTATSLNDIRTGKLGKPYFGNGIHFSISHSQGMVSVALDNQVVGIDCEKIRPLEIVEYRQLFSEEEWNQIENAPSIYDCFFEHWTKKESVIKADGRGLSIDMKSIKILNQMAYISGKSTGWQVVTKNVNKTHKLSICGSDLRGLSLREFTS